MKHLFLLLLAINLGIFIWGYQREQNKLSMEPKPRPDIGNLLLLSEREAPPVELLKPEAVPIQTQQPISEPEVEPIKELVEAQVAEEPIELAKKAFLTEASQALKEPDAEPEIEVLAAEESVEVADPQQLAAIEPELEAAAQLQPEVEAEVEMVETEIDTLPLVEAPEDEGVAPEVVPGDKTVDVGEAEEIEETIDEPTKSIAMAEPEQPFVDKVEEQTESESELEATVVAEVEEPVIAKACYMLGPLHIRLAAEKLADSLASENLMTTIKEREAEKQSGYWVLFPPTKSTQEALKKLREVKAAGLNDVWRITSGRLRNAVSLGLFGRRHNAERVKKQAENKGFFPEIQPSFTNRTEYWLHFESVDQPPIKEEKLQSFQQEYADLELMSFPCPGVVTP